MVLDVVFEESERAVNPNHHFVSFAREYKWVPLL